MASAPAIKMSDLPGEIRSIEQALMPFNVPPGLLFFNPFSEKQMQFYKEYKITGITVDEAVNGILFGNFRPFTDVKVESYNRKARTRTLTFNPFTREMEKMGRNIGDMAVTAGRETAEAMGSALGYIDWKYWVDAGSTPQNVIIHVSTRAKLFGGRFRFVVRAVGDGVVLVDDWTTAGGNDMRTSYILMANLVLMTHPQGFHRITENLIEEVTRARKAGVPYVGEIGSPSVDECADDALSVAV